MGHYSQILPVILSGGAGSRLWPLSRQAEAKQFLPLSSDRTMIQETADRLSGPEFLPPAFICNESHVAQIQAQHLHQGVDRIGGFRERHFQVTPRQRELTRS